MKCIVTDNSHSNDKGHTCPDVYCPPSSSSPNGGNYTASTCVYYEVLNKTSNNFDGTYDCPKRDFCKMSCSQINDDDDKFYDSDIFKTAERGSISYACSSGNLTGSVGVGNYQFWDQKPPANFASKNSVSLILPIVLLVLYLPLIKNFFRN